MGICLNPLVCETELIGYLWALSMPRESTTEQSLGGNAADLVGWASQDTHGNSNQQIGRTSETHITDGDQLGSARILPESSH